MKFIKRKNIDTYKPKSQRFAVENDGRAIINTDKSLTVPVGESGTRPGSGVPGMVRYNSTFEDFEVYTGYGSWGWEKLRTNRPSDVTLSIIGDGLGDGTIESIDITNGGTGYLTAPTINISAPDIGTDTATAHVTVSGGAIDTVVIDNPGTGYLTVPTVTINGGNTSATLTAVLTGALEYALPTIPVNSLGVLSATNVQIYVENVFQLPGINYTLIQSGGTAYVKFDAPIPFGKPIYAIYGWDKGQ
jgi:hypothetical protein